MRVNLNNENIHVTYGAKSCPVGPSRTRALTHTHTHTHTRKQTHTDGVGIAQCRVRAPPGLAKAGRGFGESPQSEAAGDSFSSGPWSTYCDDSYFGIGLSTPGITAVRHAKDPGHSAKSAGGGLQINTHAPYVCGYAWSGMVHGVHRTRRYGSSFIVFHTHTLTHKHRAHTRMHTLTHRHTLTHTHTQTHTEVPADTTEYTIHILQT